MLQGLLSFLPQSIKELTGGRESKLFILPFVLLYGILRSFFIIPFLVFTKLFHLIFGEGKRPQGFMSSLDRFFVAESLEYWFIAEWKK